MAAPSLPRFLCVLLLGACVAPIPSAPPALLGTVHFDVLHYDLTFHVFPDEGRLSGHTHITFLATSDMKALRLHAEGMTILNVATAESPTHPFVHQQGVLEIPFADAFSAGEGSWVEVKYQANPLGGMHFVSAKEKGIKHADHVFTQGECERARWWFPCHDIPADRASHQITATVPISWETVAAGEQVQEWFNAERGTKTVQWVMKQDMPTYLFTFAAGPFVKIEDGWEDISLSYYVEPEDLDAGVASFSHTPEVLRFISEYTGFRYPFSKYAQIAVRDFPFGGMENVTATTVTRNAIHPASEQNESPTWGLVAHEAAHQWFGDIVTCEDWPHAWLNEGFATYFNLLYRRHIQGEEAFVFAMGNAVDRYARACRGASLRALVKNEYDFPFQLFFDGTIYPGGASRLQLLRGWIGEPKFKEAIQRYLHANAFSSVTTKDFEEALTSVSGKDFSEIFQQWFFQPGYPELSLKWSVSQNVMRIELEQTQDTSLGIPEAFSFPLDFRWIESDGWHTGRRWVNAENHVWEIPVQSAPRFLEVDPHVYVPATWTFSSPDGAMESMALEGWSARSRALALRDLQSSQNPSVPDIFWQVATRDSLPGLRKQAIQSLGRFHEASMSVPRLRGAWLREKDVPTENAWLDLLALRTEDLGVVSILSGILDTADASPAARVIALRALSRLQEPRILWDYLLPWTQMDSSGDKLRSLAMTELALRLPEDERTRTLLLKKSWSGNLSSTRQTALRLLKPWLKSADAISGPDPVVSAVRNALFAGSATVRGTAAGLARLRPDLFSEDLEKLKKIDPSFRQ